MNKQKNWSVQEEFRNKKPIQYWIVHKIYHVPGFILPKSVGPFHSKDVAQNTCDKMNT